MNQIVGWLLLLWFLVICTAVAGLAFRRYMEFVRTPPPPPPEPEPPPVEQPLQMSPAEKAAARAEALKHDYHEKLDLIDSLPLPPEDKRALMNDEEERYANSMRDVLNRFATR